MLDRYELLLMANNMMDIARRFANMVTDDVDEYVKEFRATDVNSGGAVTEPPRDRFVVRWNEIDNSGTPPSATS